MTRGPDASRRLVRALEGAADRAGVTIDVAEATATGWASATFAGARHRLTLHADASARLDDWLQALPEAELPVRDHLVADIGVVSAVYAGAAVTVVLEALTVEER